MTAQGLGKEAIEAATAVVAMFNYLTRVADATGIEFDYPTLLPVFEPESGRPLAPQPDRTAWPVAAAELRTFRYFPALGEAWQRWRDYVLESTEPLTRRERHVLARAAAEECCNRWRADLLNEYTPQNAAESVLAEFARKLSRRPWQMRAADLDALRASGRAEPALSHAIAVVALQNADWRLAMGRLVGFRSRPG